MAPEDPDSRSGTYVMVVTKSETTAILPPVNAGADGTLSDWPSDSFVKDRCEVFQDYQPKNDWRTDTTVAPDQAGTTTEQFSTEIRRFLHFAPMQIFETRTLVKAFICTVAPAQLRLAVGFK